jgi:diguanylate cyclase
MLKDFFVNMVLLVAVTFIGGHWIKDFPIKENNNVLYKAVIGSFCGLAGILLLIYSIHVAGTNSMIDLRAYAVMMASYAGGIIPTIISGLIIILFRMLFFGVNISSEIALIQMVLYVVAFWLIDKKVGCEKKKWVLKSITALLVTITTDYYVLHGVFNIGMLLLQYSIIIIFAGALEYLLLDYVRTSNELFRRYKKEATKDFLTGLDNSRQFDKVLNSSFEKVQQANGILSCLMVDIDHFKKINDTYGHAVGDLVLKELSDILINKTRPEHVAARVGGEEFCILLHNCSKEQTFQIANDINKTIQEHQFPIGDGKHIHITVSIGVSMYPIMTNNLENLKEMSDTALYKAKRSGRNRVCSYEE